MFWAALTLGCYPGAVWRQERDVAADPGMIGRRHRHHRDHLCQMYASKATRRKGIKSVMANAPAAGVAEVGSSPGNLWEGTVVMAPFGAISPTCAT